MKCFIFHSAFKLIGFEEQHYVHLPNTTKINCITQLYFVLHFQKGSKCIVYSELQNQTVLAVTDEFKQTEVGAFKTRQRMSRCNLNSLRHFL